MKWKTRLAALLMALSSSVATAQPISNSLSASLPPQGGQSPVTHTLAEWNFNRLDASNNGSPPPSAGTGTATSIGGVSATFASGTGSSDPAADADSAWSLATFPAQGKARLSAGVEFKVDTTGHRGVTARFDLRASNTASRQVVVQASVDGATFVDVTRLSIGTGGAFQNGLPVDFSGVPGAANNKLFAFRIVSDFVDDAKYGAVNGNYGVSGTWRIDLVSVTGLGDPPPAVPPTFSEVPEARTALVGESISMSVLAKGTEPLHYFWYFGEIPLPGADSASYSIAKLTPADAGEYRVEVGNSAGTVVSSPIRLTVIEPDPPLDPPGEPTDPVDPGTPPIDPPIPTSTNEVRVIVVERLAELRNALDPVTLGLPPPTSTAATLVQVEGVVTGRIGSHPGNPFFVQDQTGGLAVLAAAPTPAPGTRVRAVGFLDQPGGLLLLDTLSPGPALHGTVAGLEVAAGVTVLSTGEPVAPAATLAPGDLARLDPVQLEALEGRLLTLTHVMFVGAGSDPFVADSGETLIDASGATFPLWVDPLSDLPGRIRPPEFFQATGILVQADATVPLTDGYRLVPLRAADLWVPPTPPAVSWSAAILRRVRPGDPSGDGDSLFAIQAGETLRIQVRVTDAAGGTYELSAPSVDGMPPGSGWSWIPAGPQAGTTELDFVLEPRPLEQGRTFPIAVEVRSVGQVRRLAWQIYVPTAQESRVILTEYLARPATVPGGPGWNPLNRPSPSTRPEQDDEYLELVNFGASPVDLAGWQIVIDGRPVHRFVASFTVASSNAVVLYGGGAPVPAQVRGARFVPSDDTDSGLGFADRGGRIEIYNAKTNLVLRVAYVGDVAESGHSWSRSPEPNGPFKASIPGTPLVTPGNRSDGSPFLEPSEEPIPIPIPDPPVRPETIVVTVARNGKSGALHLTWPVRPGDEYSVWSAAHVAGPFVRVAREITVGSHLEPLSPDAPGRFLRISSP